MPVRRLRIARRGIVTSKDIEALRGALKLGWPWIFHHIDGRYRRADLLTTEQNILLSYVTGISCGPAVYCGGGDHPSKATVKAVRAELKDDIAEAEKQFEGIFRGERHSYAFFAFEGADRIRRFY
jgi:hypothetical protein